jgi:hypothetical protein
MALTAVRYPEGLEFLAPRLDVSRSCISSGAASPAIGAFGLDGRDGG